MLTMDAGVVAEMVRNGVARENAERMVDVLRDVAHDEDDLKQRLRRLLCASLNNSLGDSDPAELTAPLQFPPLEMSEAGMVIKLKGFNCHKCKSDDITFMFSSARSADEGQVAFVLCGSCGADWKM